MPDCIWREQILTIINMLNQEHIKADNGDPNDRLLTIKHSMDSSLNI